MSAVNADRYTRGSDVWVALPGDTNDCRLGTVRSSYLDGDELNHVVEFGDGTRAEYTADELLAITALPPRRRPPKPASPPRPLVRSGIATAVTPDPGAAGNEP